MSATTNTDEKTRSDRMFAGQDVRPVPDPTVLTTQQLLREVLAVRELFETRLDGMDKAIGLLQAAMDRVPTTGEVYIQHEEKFIAINKQIEAYNQRIEQLSLSRKEVLETRIDALRQSVDEQYHTSALAVKTALEAAKEAVGEQNKSSSLSIAKSETNTTKQIDSIATLIQTNQKALDEKISDVKDRITVIEGRSSGVGASWGYMVGAIGLIFSLIGAVACLIVIFKH